MTMRRRLAGAAGLLLALTAPAVLADAGTDALAIRDRLLGWEAAFNARDAAGVCDLFADDLISVVPDTPPAGKAEVCGRLERLLAQDEPAFSYTADIHEVLVWDDHAAVRLSWTLTVEAAGERSTSIERGIDLFRRDPDGRWRIMRFIAFTDGPQ